MTRDPGGLISLEVTGTFPVIPKDPIPDAMDEVARLMEDSIVMNFLVGGRPPWLPLRSGEGRTPLSGPTGRLVQSVKHASGVDWAEVSAMDTIHQEGGYIRPVEGKLMVFEIGGHLIFTYRRKGFNIPARPYLILQDEDIENIYSVIPNAIIGAVEYVEI